MTQYPSGDANRFQLASNSPYFMETESSLPRLQEPSTFPFPEPDQSSSCPPTIPLHEDPS